MTRDPRLARWAEETEPTPSSMDAVRRRARKTLAPQPRDRRPLFAGLGLGLAAAIVLIVAAWPGAPPAVAIVDAPLQATLGSASPTPLAATPEVRLVYEGSGTVAGTARAPRISWDSGAITVEVEPGRGIDLVVATPEAEVRVVGTGFVVTRDLLGSRVEVSHGVVAVRCQDGGAESRLEAGGTQTCLPVRGVGLLARAGALDAAGADPDLILETVRLGLAAEPAGAVHGELIALQASVLARAGRDAEALAAARGYLASGEDLRRAEVRRLAAQIALRVEGCDGALPLLREQAEAAPEVGALLALADCLPSGAERGAALDRAGSLATTPADREAIAARRD